MSTHTALPSGTRGVIGIPCSEPARHSLFWSSVLGLTMPPATAVNMAIGSSPAQNRNMIIETALACESVEWVLFLDDDHVMPPDTISRLLAHDVDVVSVLYLHRSAPFRPLVFESFDPSGSGGVAWRTLTATDRGLIRCAAVPAGGLLIRRRVLEILPRPWFRLGHINPEEWGDDIDFCRTLQSFNIPVHCDLDTVFGHLGTMELRPFRTGEGEWMTMAARGDNALVGRTWK